MKRFLFSSMALMFLLVTQVSAARMALMFLLVTQVSAARMGLYVFPEPQPAPSLALSDQHGEQHRLEDYWGNTVIVNFWASWCAPCRKEMPSLKATQTTLSDDGLVVLAVSMDDSWEDVASGLKGYENDFVALLDKNGEAAGLWEVLAVPTAFVLDKRGRIRLRIVGGYDWENPELRSRIEVLLAENYTAGRSAR